MKKLIESLFVCSACIIWDIYLLNTTVNLITGRDNWKWVFMLIFLFIPKITPDKEEKSEIIIEE